MAPPTRVAAAPSVRRVLSCEDIPRKTVETAFGALAFKWMTILNAAQEAASMGRRKRQANAHGRKTILRLPDLEQSKNAVLNSLAAASSQESYAHAIDEFIGWYCSEPRLAFNRSVVLRYRFFLEQKNLAPSTINVRLAAVRRLAFEAADTGLLSPELAAGIGRVKGAKRLGVRIGNWLTVEQSRTLLAESGGDSLRGKRDRAILALLIGCHLAGGELEQIQFLLGHASVQTTEHYLGLQTETATRSE